MADEPIKRKRLTAEARRALNALLAVHLDQTGHRLGCINDALDSYYPAVKLRPSGKKPVVVCWRQEDQSDALQMIEKHLQRGS
jgi:hypothetical protein